MTGRTYVFLAVSDDGKEYSQLATNENGTEKKIDGDNYVVVTWQVEDVIRLASHDISVKKLLAGSRAVLDLYQMSWLLYVNGVIPNRSLESLAKWSGAVMDDESPGKMCHVMETCYRILVHRIALGLQVEGIGREVATKAYNRVVEIAQSLVGNSKIT
jgi:hypothetical protein